MKITLLETEIKQLILSLKANESTFTELEKIQNLPRSTIIDFKPS